jgi:serine/threonine-protein phosphatase 2B catalytic subunit
MDTLPDPFNDRQIKSIPPPPHKPLEESLLYPAEKHIPDWRVLKTHMQKEGPVSKAQCAKILRDTLAMIKKEPNLLSLHDPVTVVGDIHGQYYDMIKMLDVGGNPETTKYLFLGDYVDRGSFSVEVCLLLFSLKLNYPSTIYMLRGNHECRQMTAFFNFRAECLYKYDEEMYILFMEVFDSLPISCLVNDKFLALHGGISPELKTIADLKNLNRF